VLKVLGHGEDEFRVPSSTSSAVESDASKSYFFLPGLIHARSAVVAEDLALAYFTSAYRHISKFLV
jgi:hypothetical protein